MELQYPINVLFDFETLFTVHHRSFPKIKKTFFGILDPINVAFDNKINNDWGHVTDVPAETKTIMAMRYNI